MPQLVIDEMVDVIKTKNANLGGAFVTTKAAVSVVAGEEGEYSQEKYRVI